MVKQSGQVVIILLLVMVVALALGLSMIGRSTSEISTSTRTEDSSRAFSAAEAGIERALKVTPGNPVPGINLSNRAQTSDIKAASLPISPPSALRYPSFGKEAFAQFWLAKPEDITSAGGAPGQDGFPDEYYNQPYFNVYFGIPLGTPPLGYDYDANPDNKPAVEVNVISRDGSDYVTNKYLFDTYRPGPDTTRNSNNFLYCTELQPTNIVVNYDFKEDAFYCRAQIPSGTYFSGTDTQYPIMARIRILYSSISHPVALQPVTGASRIDDLPAQANIYTSTGTSGSVQRKLQVFRQKYVMPHYFDYVLFSAGQLDKSNP